MPNRPKRPMDPDAEILATVREIGILDRIIKDMPMEADSHGRGVWARCLPYHDEMQAHVARLAAMQAQTPLGLMAKACVAGIGLGVAHRSEPPDKALLRSVLHDLAEVLA